MTDAQQDYFPWEQLIPILPELLGILLLLALFFIVGPRRIVTAIGRVKRIAVAGLELELTDEVEAAATKKDISLSSAEVQWTARLLSDAASVLSCTRLLWVDDNPNNNLNEMKVLRRMCVSIDIATSTEDARESLRKGIYELVISDMRRGTEDRAGEEMLHEVRKAHLSPDLIYYVGTASPVPKGAFGLTARPDELFKLIVRALRKRQG
jgi:CheY-like chemotaxis protein